MEDPILLVKVHKSRKKEKGNRRKLDLWCDQGLKSSLVVVKAFAHRQVFAHILNLS